MLKRYPFDVTGASPGNLVAGERHDLGEIRPHRLFITREGAFFNESLVIKQGEKTLTLSKDYIFDLFWHDATAETGKGVSCGFRIINKTLVGEIQVTYQVVGGKYHTRTEGYKKVLESLPWQKEKVYWEEVLEQPDSWVPTRHMHHVNDVFGLSPMYYAIMELGKSLERQSVLKLKAVYDRFLKLKQYVDANLGKNDEFKQLIDVELQQIKAQMDKLPSTDEIDVLFDEKLSVYKTEVNEKFEAVNANREVLGTRIEEVNSVFQNYVRANTEEIQRYYNELIAMISMVGENARTELTAVNNVLQSQIDSGYHGLRQEIRQVDDKHDQGQRQQDALIQAANNAINGLERQLNGLTETINQTIQPFKDSTAEALDRINNQLATLTGNNNTVKEEIENKINEIKQQIGQLNSEDIQQLKNWKDNDVIPALASLSQRVSQVENTDTTHTEQIALLNRTISQLGEDLQREIADTQAEIGIRIMSNVADLNNTIATNKSMTDGDIAGLREDKADKTALNDLDITLNQKLEALKNNQQTKVEFNEAELEALLTRLLDKKIAQARENEETQPDINTLPLNPPGNVDIDYKDETYTKVYPIKTMGYEVEELNRQVFVPTTNIEFTRSTDWVVPDLYDGLTAQVFVTSAMKVSQLADGNLLLTPPSTVMDYILLKGGQVIPISVGTISSFGEHITNDGLNPAGTLEPTYPIVMSQSQVNRPDDNPLSHHGKHGRVRIVV